MRLTRWKAVIEYRDRIIEESVVWLEEDRAEDFLRIFEHAVWPMRYNVSLKELPPVAVDSTFPPGP